MTVWRGITNWLAGLMTGSALLFASVASPVSPDYPVENSMSALSRFPWISTCVGVLSSDLAGRPIVATRTPKRGGETVEVDDPALDLLDAPNAATTGYLFRKQLWVDYLLSGNAYVWRPEGQGSVAIYRLHPALVRPLPGPMGMVAAYEYTDGQTGQMQMLPPEQVLHIRDVSWQDDAQSLLGESPIRCLHDDLLTEMGARTTSREAASKGRPDMMFSTEQPLGDKGADPIVKRWEEAMKKRHSAFVTGQGMKAQQLSWSPKELDFTEQRRELRDTTLAVYGVPPSRAGIPGANYATSRQEEKTYWERNKGRVRVFNDAFSRLAQPGVRLVHDFSDVEALQVGYEARQVRVMNWVAMGWDPEEAAAFEGFEGLPRIKPKAPAVPAPGAEKDPAKPAPGGAAEDEPDEPADKAIRAAVWMHLRVAEATYAALTEGMDTRLLVHSMTEQLFRAFDEAGLSPLDARTHAEDIAATTDEAARMALPGAFAQGRAARLTERITTSLRRAA